MKKWIAVLTVGIVCAFSASAVCFARECGEIREKLLRVQVLANSDDEADQRLKLDVRDRLVTAAAELLEGVQSKEEAMARISQGIGTLEEAAKDELLRQGSEYGVTVELTRTMFPTREYGALTLPAGTYDAVRVYLGQAKGANWWCVMFPAMCLPSAEPDDASDALSTVLDENELGIVEGGVKYRAGFLLVEWFERLSEWVSGIFAG